MYLKVEGSSQCEFRRALFVRKVGEDCLSSDSIRRLRTLRFIIQIGRQPLLDCRNIHSGTRGVIGDLIFRNFPDGEIAGIRMSEI